MTGFVNLLQSFTFEDGALCGRVADNWMQGRTVYGGMSAALCLEAALRTAPDLPPLRSAQIAFIGPTEGDLRARATILRRGKSVTYVNADLEGEKGLATRAVFAFGAARPSVFAAHFTPPPDLPGPEASAPFFPDGVGPAFAQNFEVFLARGGRPISGSTEHDHFLWVRHCDPRAISTVALLALADMPPPAMMPMFRQVAPISTMTWALNFLTDHPQTNDCWWLLESRAENAAEGYSSQDMFVWNRKGEPLIAGRQSVAIFL